MKQSVLIVDDDEDMRLLLQMMLGRSGFAVVGADSGREALKQVKAARPDVVVLDVMMPDINGFEVCRALRDEEATADLPVIMLSARMSADAITAGLKAGANEYLTKPISWRELTEVIDRVLQDASPTSNRSGRH